jgi:enoyl-CoA hydratase/carnithine racemase
MSRVQTADEKRLVLASLAKVADPAALEIVEPHLRDSEVKAEAERAALSIAHSILDSAPEKAQATAKRLLNESKSDSIRNEATRLLQKLDGIKAKK